MPNEHPYRSRLYVAAQQLNVVLDDTQVAALLAYIEALQRWNRTYNLTALRDPEQMLIQHVFDSLAIVPSFHRVLDENTGKARIVDVGSGAGLPGVVLAVTQADWNTTCVDAVEKKMAFVRQMSGALRLPHLQAVHGRVETLEPLGANIVVSRAFASLVDFATLAGRHAAPGGVLAAMKGHEPQEEIITLEQQTDWRVSHIEPLFVPELNAQRCLVWLRRQGTP
ncbi:MAG TPA: 16S rRNA (guanine(527)-N(7))-methyltransferase RsmG [Candidimonas sp.]|nr:16S rRNA (guanine(527)-N(7))-methyltransferase RsmG [Candidimonas sp.]